MPTSCCIKGCSSYAITGESLPLFRFPSIWTRTPALKSLSTERRNLWLAAANRKKLDPNIARVCSKHFHTGRTARLQDKLHPDWVPSLHLGYNTRNNPLLAMRRYERQKRRQANKSQHNLQGSGGANENNSPENADVEANALHELPNTNDAPETSQQPTRPTENLCLQSLPSPTGVFEDSPEEEILPQASENVEIVSEVVLASVHNFEPEYKSIGIKL